MMLQSKCNLWLCLRQCQVLHKGSTPRQKPPLGDAEETFSRQWPSEPLPTLPLQATAVRMNSEVSVMDTYAFLSCRDHPVHCSLFNRPVGEPINSPSLQYQCYTNKYAFESVQFRQSWDVRPCPLRSCLCAPQTDCWAHPCSAGGGHSVPQPMASHSSPLWLAAQLQWWSTTHAVYFTFVQSGLLDSFLSKAWVQSDSKNSQPTRWLWMLLPKSTVGWEINQH